MRRPREDDEVDEKLVADAVVWIRGKVAETLSRGVAEIGEYLLDTFFGGDAEQVRSHAPTKNASYRALLERCESTELPLKRSALHAAVSTAVMRRQLPEASPFKQLPPSHQAALLPLRDPKKVERLAQRALTKHLSVRELKQVVSEEASTRTESDDEPRRGRPRKPLITKALEGSLRLFLLEEGKRSFTKAHVDELSDDAAEQALKDARSLVASLEKLIEKLEGR